MTVHCAECGEELLGAVNRCWRCGKNFVSRTGNSELPPQRRTPIVGPLDAPLEAVLIVDESDDSSDGESRWKRRGSPFASAAVDRDVRRPSSENLADIDSIQATQYPQGAGAGGGAIAAVLLAVFGLASDLVFPLGGLILAAVGVALGVWGLNSPRRRVAFAGLILCCLTFTLSIVLIAAKIYQGRGI